MNRLTEIKNTIAALELERRNILSNVMGMDQKPSFIKSVVCAHTGVSVNDISKRTRRREIVQARHIAMYFLSKYTRLSLKSIGDQFGSYDHSTVIHAKNLCEDQLDINNKVFTKLINDIEKELNERFGEIHSDLLEEQGA